MTYKNPTGKARLNLIIRKIIPLNVILSFYNWRLRTYAGKMGLGVKRIGDQYHIKKQNNVIVISKKHSVYLNEIIENFDVYFSAVKPIKCCGVNIVDFSTPRWHWVTGFELFPILFPSFVEPVVTTKQYIEFAELKEEAVVIDLGAYSGLTSILFDMAIPLGGQVIALEADSQNIIACKENLALYEKVKKRKIELINAAVWKNDLGVTFSSEGNMGSSAVNFVGKGRGDNISVPSLTLIQIAEKFQLSKVDFIKCDIEGGETEIFDCPQFFSKFSPKILIECHMVNGINTAKICDEVLSKYGYSCEQVEQQGFPLPLLMCKRPVEK
jgi:FkbM family methyltransferase